MSETAPFFGLAQMHILMASVGAAVIVAYLVPRIILRGAASSTAILMIPGLVILNAIPGMSKVPDPTSSPKI